MINKVTLKASSIMETVIAITIITLCSLISTMVFSNVINQTPLLKKYEYEYELVELIQQIKEEKDISISNFKFEGFTIEKKVTKDPNNQKLNKVQLVMAIEKKIVNYSFLVYEENKNDKN